MKNSGSFHISAQNIDYGYLLEPPQPEIRKLMYTPCKPQFYCIKVGFKGVKPI